MKIKILIILLAFFSVLNAQSVENELFKKIQIKIEKDSSYLNTYKVNSFEIKEEINFNLNDPIFKDMIIFEKSDQNTQYNLVFMLHPIISDSLIILKMEKEKSYYTQNLNDTSKGDTAGGGLGDEWDTSLQTQTRNTDFYVYSFKQIYQIQNANDTANLNKFYKHIYIPLKRLFYEYYYNNKKDLIEGPYLIKKIDEASESDGDTTIINTTAFDDGGYSSKNNLQFLKYYYLNGSFYYPRIESHSISQGNIDATLHDREKRILERQKVNIHLNLNFSRITFQHPIMRKFFGNSDDNDGLSLEISTEEKIMNIVPWTSLSTTFAGRTLFMLGGEETKVEDKYYLDTRFFYKLRTNTVKLAKDLPFVIADSPKLNFTNRLGIEFNMTRELALPFLNFFLALGAKEFNDPYVGFYENGQIYSYFTMTQARAVMSFYWNTSGDDVHRFRLDLGGVYYDKFKVLYDLQSPIQNNSNIDIKDLDLKVSDIQKQDGQIFPMIEIHFNFVPNKNELFGVSLRAFDNIGRLSGWLKLLDFDNAVLRFEATYISQPLGRKPREWETRGGTIMQLNYRYGM